MAIWQLGNCAFSISTSFYPTERSLGYLLLGLISSLVFRAIRDALPNNPEAQERILGAGFTALALADVGFVHFSYLVTRLTNCIIGNTVSLSALQKFALRNMFQYCCFIYWSPRRAQVLLWQVESHDPWQHHLCDISFERKVFRWSRMHRQAFLTSNFVRLAWFAGVGRTAYYYGKRVKVD